MKRSVTLKSLFTIPLICGQLLFAAPPEVLHIHIPGLLEGESDNVDLFLYHRDGEVVHGYALAPERDNLVHRIDATPAPAVAWITPRRQTR